MVDLLEFLQRYPVFLNVVTGFITFVVGLFIGHKTALWRDKRKEFNELAKPIKVALELNLNEPNSQKIYVQELLALGLMLSGRKKRRYEKLCENYQKYIPCDVSPDPNKSREVRRNIYRVYNQQKEKNIREATKPLNDFIKLK